MQREEKVNDSIHRELNKRPASVVHETTEEEREQARKRAEAANEKPDWKPDTEIQEQNAQTSKWLERRRKRISK